MRSNDQVGRYPAAKISYFKANAVVQLPAQQSTLTFSNLVRTWVVVSGYGTVLYSRIIIGYYVRCALEFTTIALMTDILHCFPLYFCSLYLQFDTVKVRILRLIKSICTFRPDGP
jgi:hypothetical protein